MSLRPGPVLEEVLLNCPIKVFDGVFSLGRGIPQNSGGMTHDWFLLECPEAAEAASSR